MPWTVADAKEKNKGLSPQQASQWVAVANNVLKRELAKGTLQARAEQLAIMSANAAVKKKTEGVDDSGNGDCGDTCAFCEFVDSRGLRLKVDREKNVIEGVKILGLVSQNGREYLKEAAARAVPLYEGARINVDHPYVSGQLKPAQPRSYADRIGVLRNIRVEHGDGGLRGDLHFNPKHALAEQLAWDAEHAPENVGLSHNVDGRGRQQNGRQVIEEITKVRSVDLVADPATTHGLFEQVQSNNDEGENMEWTDITLESLRANRPDLVTQLTEAAVTEHVNSEEVRAKAAEAAEKIKTLTEEVATLKAEGAAKEKAAKIDALLAKCELPESVFDEKTIEHVKSLEFEPAEHFLETLQRTYKAAGGKPKSTAQHRANGEAIANTKSFIEGIT